MSQIENNEVLQCIHDRRSVRRFQKKPVSAEQLTCLIQAAQAAPSAMNEQPWYFAAIQKRELIEQLGQLLADSGEDPYYGASLLIVGFGRREAHSPITDVTLAMANMMLAAQSLGLGTYWIDYSRHVFNHPQFAGLQRSLGVPEGYFCVGSLIVGVPDEQPQAHTVQHQIVSVVG